MSQFVKKTSSSLARFRMKASVACIIVTLYAALALQNYLATVYLERYYFQRKTYFFISLIIFQSFIFLRFTKGNVINTSKCNNAGQGR